MAAAASFVVSLIALAVSIASVGLTLHNNRRADPIINVELSEVGVPGMGPAIQVKVINKGRAAARVDYWGVVDLKSGNQISWAYFVDPSQLFSGDPSQLPEAPTVIPAHDSRPFRMPKQKLLDALEAMGSPAPQIQGRISVSTGKWYLSRSVITF
ncbi:hypothetical protein K7640_15665 [Micromonospora sp. PLK6-60]|uniref:hypothetical protein n=1 Tax=Micromonospora sp. PLK6-60 TaxID=2873383 RepID=UPI001CA749AD|nr:hypothetical protein [Micromonospora sp. PLK6-60]MBY8873272.1 hypothetical protein [Micromonospora sp. PLK6-60]